MKVVVACGGTGGHAFPGLAVAEELRSRGHDVTVWDSGRDVESGVMRNWSGAVFSTGARQLSFKNLFAIWRSISRCRAEMRRKRPDVMLAMGSYSSLPPVLAARRYGIPVVLHEANTVPGRAVEFLSRYAVAVATSFEMTAKFLPGIRTVQTGLPVRESISKGVRFIDIPKDAFVVFVTGGSQGAHAVNMLLSEALVMAHDELSQREGEGNRPLYVIHQTGIRDEATVAATYTAGGVNARVRGFEHEMANAFASADLVVARAGASTCFELTACGKPALLIPLPTALRDHQQLNANAFASHGAANVGIQEKLTPRQVARYIIAKYDHPEQLAKMRDKMEQLAVPDAAAKVADLVERKGEDIPEQTDTSASKTTNKTIKEK